MIRETVQAIPDPNQRGTRRRLRQRARHTGPFPVLTATALTATLLGTITRLFTPAVFDALRRNPTELGHWQIWRLLSPVLVQGDHSLAAIVGVFALCGVIGYWGERTLPRSEWFVLYVLGALAGHGIGEAFQPYQSGMSVAFAGILGGLAARILLDRDPKLKPWRIRFALLIPLAILDTALRDIHGAPFLVGLAVGSAFELQNTPDTQKNRPNRPHKPRATDLLRSEDDP